MPSHEDLSQHPCWFDHFGQGRIGHRSGGFGDTCVRCGTKIANDGNNTTIGSLKWEPVVKPKPFQPGSLERKFYDNLLGMSLPVHNGWKEEIARQLANLVP